MCKSISLCVGCVKGCLLSYSNRLSSSTPSPSVPLQVTVCKDIYYLARRRIFQENPDLNRAQLILEVNNPFIQVGHNVYILAHQLARYNPLVATALKQQETDDAIVYYKEHTAQIEVRQA